MDDDQKRAVIAAAQKHGVIGVKDDALDEAETFVESAKKALEWGVSSPAVHEVLEAAGVEHHEGE
jgi:hypothetical protein